MAEDKKYYHNIDLDKNKLKNPLLNPLSTSNRNALSLSTNDKGYVTFDTDLNSQYFWNGTQWILSSGGSTPSLQSVLNIGNGASNYGGTGNASIQLTNFTNNRTLYINDNSYPTIKIVDNLNSAHTLSIDLDKITLNGTSYNWSSIVSSSIPSLQQVTDVGNYTTNSIQWKDGSGNVNAQINSDGSGYFANTFDVYSEYLNGDPLLRVAGSYVFVGDFAGDVNNTYTLWQDADQTITSIAYNGYTFGGGDANFNNSGIGNLDNNSWKINSDGSGYFSTNNIRWDIAGFLYGYDYYNGGSNCIWSINNSGIATFGSPNGGGPGTADYSYTQIGHSQIVGFNTDTQFTAFSLNPNGSASFANNNVSIDTNGNITSPAFITSGGTSSQYVAGDGSLITFPTIPSLTGYVPYTGATSNLNLGSYGITTNTITLPGTTSQYIRGDGSLATFPSLSNYVQYSSYGTNNISANNFFDGFTSVAASGTQIVLTVNSTPSYLITGSGGQTIKLPNATTLPNGTLFNFNNNQSSGTISINNNSNTLVKSVPSGGYLTLVLVDNSSAAGSWDTHFQAPSNVSWSTNTFDYAGSITSATWNGVNVALNRGGTGANTASGARTNLGSTTVGDNLFTLTNPSAITFLRVNADNTVSTLDAATFRTAIGAGTGTFTLPSLTAGSVLFSDGTTIAQNNSKFFWDNTNYYLGLNTAAPTHTLTLGSTSNGVTYYNTSDQTTNYERSRMYWSGNNFYITTEQGGTGSARTINFIQATQTKLTIGSTQVLGAINIGFNSGTVGSIFGLSPLLTVGSGIQSSLAIIPTVNQSSTGGSKGLWISPYFQTTGSGGNYLIDAGINSAGSGSGTHTSLFAVGVNGELTLNVNNSNYSPVLNVISKNSQVASNADFLARSAALINVSSGSNLGLYFANARAVSSGASIQALNTSNYQVQTLSINPYGGALTIGSYNDNGGQSGTSVSIYTNGNTNASNSFSIYSVNGNAFNYTEIFKIFGGGNVSIGGNTASSLFQIYQPTTGVGTITTSGTTITGTNTQFTNTFKVGDTILLGTAASAWSSGTAYSVGQSVSNGGNTYIVTTAGTGGTGPTGTSSTPAQFGGAGPFFAYNVYTISAIASDTSMTTGTLPTIASNTNYTLTGGARFNVYGRGDVVFGSTSTMWYDARYGALNIGSSTSQSNYLLNVSGNTAVAFTTYATGGGQVTHLFNSSGSAQSTITLLPSNTGYTSNYYAFLLYNLNGNAYVRTGQYSNIYIGGGNWVSSQFIDLAGGLVKIINNGAILINTTDDTINKLQVAGRTIIKGQLSYGGSVPTIAAGTGAGTSPTVSIVGTNNGGVITVTTGTLPSTSATVVTVTYTGAFATGSQIILYPTNSATALLSGVSMVYTTGTTTTFTITSGTTALTASTTYSWSYHVTGY
jgi:hypothetical protein